jgi:hypothetical protein
VIVVGINSGGYAQHGWRKTWADHRRARDCHSIAFSATQGNWVYEAGGTGAGTAISQMAHMDKTGLVLTAIMVGCAVTRSTEDCYLSVSPAPSKAHSENKLKPVSFDPDLRGNGKN